MLNLYIKKRGKVSYNLAFHLKTLERRGNGTKKLEKENPKKVRGNEIKY